MSKEPRQRLNIVATYEIPAGKEAYAKFRMTVHNELHILQELLGSDAILEYAAIEKIETDLVLGDR